MLININKYCTNNGKTESYVIDLDKVTIAEVIKGLEEKHFDIEDTDFIIETNSRLRWMLKHMGMHIADLKREGKI